MGVNKKDNFYTKHVEVEEKAISITKHIVNHSDNLIKECLEALFDEGELYLRKRVLEDQDIIEKEFKTKIKDIFSKLDEDEKSSLRVFSYLETELMFCAKKASKMLDENESMLEKKAKKGISSFIEEDFPKINYGVVIKILLEEVFKYRKETPNEIIEKIFSNIAHRWKSRYIQNLKEIVQWFEARNFNLEIKESEEERQVSENINFKRRIRKHYEQHKENSSEEEGKEENIDNVQDDNIYKILKNTLFTNQKIKDLMQGKSVEKPSEFIDQVKGLEDSNAEIKGFDNFKTIFQDAIIPEENLTVLKIITDIFEKILENENLSNESKILMYKLQFPVIKTSFIDKDQIMENESIVNETLNQLTNELKLVGPEQKHYFDNVQKDVTDFSSIDFNQLDKNSVLEEWKKLKEKIKDRNKKVRVIENRNKQKEQGENLYKNAQEKAEKDIQSIIIKANYINNKALEFINEKIKKSLVYYELMDAQNGSDRYIKCFESIEKWLLDIFVNEDKESAKKTSKVVYKNLTESTPSEKNDIKKGIEEIYRNAFGKNNTVKEKDVADFKRKQYNHYNKIQFRKEEPKNIKKDCPFYQKILGIKLGDWIEIKEENTVKNCKLLLKLDSDKKFIFVGSDGTKNATLTIEEFYNMLKESKCSILDKTTVMERALNKIFSN